MRNTESPPARQTIPPINIDWICATSERVTMKGAVILARLATASTIPVPVFLMFEGNDSTVNRIDIPNANA